jgi:hypothetical protein
VPKQAALSLRLYLIPRSFSLSIEHFQILGERDPFWIAVIMAGLKMAILALVIISVSLGGKWVGVEAQMHHVVGGDRGWDRSSDVSSWPSDRIFRIGDKICKPLLLVLVLLLLLLSLSLSLSLSFLTRNMVMVCK